MTQPPQAPEPLTEESEHVPFMTRGAAYATMILGVLCLGMAAFNVYLWNDSRTTRSDLRAERAARLTQRQQDERAANIARVTQCRQAIPAIARANAVIGDLRRDHVDRARQAESLAAADPTVELRKVHLAIAKQQEMRAADLQDFPPVTKAQCDELAKQLLGPNWEKILAPPKTAKD
jgi:hypothetical protein